jgi:hypothetical protein
MRRDMAPGETVEKRWVIDRRIQVAIVFPLLAQFVGLVIWGAVLDRRVLETERDIMRLQQRLDAVDGILRDFYGMRSEFYAFKVDLFDRIQRIDKRLDELTAGPLR